MSNKKPVKNNTKAVKSKRKASQPSFSTNPSIELKKVTWPNQETLVKSTLLIISMVIVLTVYVSGADSVCSKIFYLLRELV